MNDFYIPLLLKQYALHSEAICPTFCLGLDTLQEWMDFYIPLLKHHALHSAYVQILLKNPNPLYVADVYKKGYHRLWELLWGWISQMRMMPKKPFPNGK